MRGRRFLHPRLGFTFMAPEGFTLDNTTQAVLGVSRRRAGIAARRRACLRAAMTEYLTSGWIDGIDSASVADVGISGFVAATATAKGDQWAFRLYAVRFGSDVYYSSSRASVTPRPTAASAKWSAPSAA